MCKAAARNNYTFVCPMGKRKNQRSSLPDEDTENEYQASYSRASMDKTYLTPPVYMKCITDS